ncbi:hypothetical protein CHELA40_13108 [Chelatococcus asaccharovorans]|nr:hypothetical protein CHELA40_13108 [Chelatococcus asaccharovorans]CAH1680288.1 hypothetical protein CHELA17_62513 [Chelatococcus asaccharovorans]
MTKLASRRATCAPDMPLTHTNYVIFYFYVLVYVNYRGLLSIRDERVFAVTGRGMWRMSVGAFGPLREA